MSTTTLVETTTLTADDIAALRMADTVVFRHVKGAGEIVAQKDGGYYGAPRIFTAKQQRLFPEQLGVRDRGRSIAVKSSAKGYADGGDFAWWDEDATIAATSMSAAQYAPTWTTIAGLLKIGDEIRLSWQADNNNDLVREAGLHVDMLYLIIVRGGKEMTFDLDVRITTNNSARMIRRHGW